MAPPSIALSLLPLAVLLCSALLATGARPTTFAPAPTPALMSQLLAAARLNGVAAVGPPPQQCWEALVDMKSCTGEVILFFLNGEAYLGPGCCRAIRVIEKSCWGADAMMSVIGFTPEEGDMLKGYCDAGDDNDNGGQGRRLGSSATTLSGRAHAYDLGVVAVARENVIGTVAGRKGASVRH